MKSNKLISRLLERAANRAAAPGLQSFSEKPPASPQVSVDEHLVQPPLMRSVAAAPSSPKIDAPSMPEESGAFLEDEGGDEPPMICWKHKLYRQRVVDGGLEPYGPPVGDC